MNIQLAKENIIKNLIAECEKVEGAYALSKRRGAKKTTYIFNIGEFVKNAMDAIEYRTREEIDSEFLSKAIMIVSGLKGDIWQITKKEWNEIIKRNKRQLK